MGVWSSNVSNRGKFIETHEAHNFCDEIRIKKGILSDDVEKPSLLYFFDFLIAFSSQSVTRVKKKI